MGVRTPNYIKKLFFDVSYGISNRNISINILKGRTNTISCGRTPHRVRELKSSNAPDAGTTSWGRTPHGVRELKS